MTSTDARFRAVVKGAFELRGRGTVLAIEILDGKVAARDQVAISMPVGAPRLVEVKAVGFVDHEIGRPTFHAYVTLLVEGIAAADITIGAELQSP